MAAISTLVLSDNLSPKEHAEDLDTPTTPRPGRFSSSHLDSINDTAIQHPRPSPTSSQPPQPSTLPVQRDGPGPAIQHGRGPSSGGGDRNSAADMDLDDEDLDDSDNEEEDGAEDSASRKKKGQRFFCSGYPPCNLSFTRSEHLARHIRKHTGERPFQCHCNRRFSRLDNLRQHAQTVHVNEEIPTDSLAATGTRFQRQIRTDRVRPTGRPRTGTAGSTGGHSRGHSRNLSTSSIGSTSSNYSVVTEAKRRPPPLLMASESNRNSLVLEPPQTPPAQYRGYEASNGSGFSTPTSANFSTTPGSPGFLSSIGSPPSSHSRRGSFYSSRPPARRLSVPSGPNPFQSPYPPAYPMTYMNPGGSSDPHTPPNAPSFASQPSSSITFQHGHSVSSTDDWRRRTWHPSTHPATNLNYGRPATSGLTYSQTPDAPQPAHAHHAIAAAAQAPRLPGIESFDHVQHRPYTPPRRQPSPMQLDGHPADTAPPTTARYSDYNHRPGHVAWDIPRPSQYPELDDHVDRNPPTASWGQQTLHELQNVGARHTEGQQRPNETLGPIPFHGPPRSRDGHDAQGSGRYAKRSAWYNGPVMAARTSPEDSSSSDGVPTPGMTAVEVHPMIMNSHGYMEPPHSAMQTDAQQTACLAPPAYMDSARHQRNSSFGSRGAHGGEMNRLDALVAVATSGEMTR
ncbi:biofilm and cell wall regulator 1 [Exophiala mesophila]|uniref:Biofilm and cell wall regulator 1 n=1 Tax=Exophiala mesophila TaxID=212818 RepID=A0A0D1ZQA6_EXOME|nr:biofilm and cell wall regulator 1 [Exophiala mesophila]KIV96797.1 biofilm and cell wall regulator 1 [Exophiala mesophila]